MQVQALSFSQTVNLIATIGHKRTVIVEGENGIGKTALFHALKRMDKFAKHIAVNPIDCTQLSDGSVWMPDIDRDAGVSRELTNERFGVSKTNQFGVNGSKPILVMLDEIAKAPNFIKNVLAPIVYERRVGNDGMPEGSVVFCGTNLGVEGLGDNIQAHLRNRLVFVQMRKPTAEEWCHWALDAGVHSSVIAFVTLTPTVMDSFLDYEKGGKYEGRQLDKDNGMIFNPRSTAKAYATPRSLVAASDVLSDGLDVLDDHTIEHTLCGTVGEPTARAMLSTIRFGREITSIDRIRHDPETAPLSDNPTVQLVQVFKLVSDISTREDAEKATTYVMRMRPELQAVFTNNVATSQRIGLYATLTNFGALLREHKIYFPSN